MPLPNIFSKEVSDRLIERIGSLTPTTTPQWGKMNVAQMLAHCCVPYEMTFETKHKKPNPLMRWILKTFVKDGVVNDRPYKKNTRTAPAFLISGERQFHIEQLRLIDFIRKVQELGAAHFDHKEYLSFGRMSRSEWNNLFYKHLDHHLTQFGV